mgnify:CR=1 FL=1
MTGGVIGGRAADVWARGAIGGGQTAGKRLATPGLPQTPVNLYCLPPHDWFDEYPRCAPWGRQLLAEMVRAALKVRRLLIKARQSH